MIIEQKMAEAINDQIQAELFSSYLYLAMAADFESKNLKGMARWMRKQAAEEQVHGMKFFDYLVERGGRVELKAIEQPQAEWSNPREAFEAAYVHEQKVTARIWKLADQAGAAKDHATSSLLKWFVDEQVEEEASVSEIVEKLKMIGDKTPGLMFLDKELGAR
jgi:ferritin